MRLLILALGLAVFAIGLAYLHSASYDGRTGTYLPYAKQQLVWLLVALAGFAAASAIPYQRFERLAYAFYVAALLLLAGLPFAGSVTNGARSWYHLGGGVKLQPSELMKLALICALARYLMHRAPARGGLGSFAAPLLLAGPPLALILLEPDFGTAMVFVPVVLAVLFAAGARLRHFGLAFGAVLAAAPIVWGLALKPYQRERILVFLDPARDPLRRGFHALQSRIAIGSGGLSGAGYGEGTQTQLHYLPESHTDFIFAVVGEEGGFLVAGLLLAAYLALVLACLEVASRTREPFGRLVAVGVSALLGAQAAINVAMTMGLAPITGITLPFVSYGGSSLVTSFVALGLVANVASHPEPVLFKADPGAAPSG